MSSTREDVQALERAARALLEARDILERAASVVGAVDPDDLGALLEEAHMRYLERFGRYDLEPAHKAHEEALRAAVEPIARCIIGQKLALENMWVDYCQRLGHEAPRVAFGAVVARAIAAVGPARKQRTVLRQIAALLETAGDTVSAADLHNIIRDSGVPVHGPVDASRETLADMGEVRAGEPSIVLD